MNAKVIAAAAAALGLAALTAQPAAANVYNWEYVDGPLTASLTLTATLSSGDTYDVTAISGTWDGESITGIVPIGACCESPANDNLIFPNDDQAGPGTGFLDLGGIGFATASETINLFDTDGGYDYLVLGGGGGGPGTLTVPEPASWVLMLAGFGGLGAMLRRRKLNLA